VALPPLKAFFFTLFSIYFGVSVMNIPEFGMDADIFELKPCREGKNLLYNPAGFGAFNLEQTSLVILK
jgi:hypothetical protein